jgi:hypothetical protein
MRQTMLHDQKTVKIIADNLRISSDDQNLPSNVVIIPMKILDKPERIQKKRKGKQ